MTGPKVLRITTYVVVVAALFWCIAIGSAAQWVAGWSVALVVVAVVDVRLTRWERTDLDRLAELAVIDGEGDGRG